MPPETIPARSVQQLPPRRTLQGERLQEARTAAPPWLPHRWSARPWLVVAALIALSTLLRMTGFHAPLGIDEGGIAVIASDWFDSSSEAAGSLYGRYWIDRPPLLLAVYGVAVELGGDTGVRVLGALSAAILIPLVTGIAQLVGGMRSLLPAGVIAAVLLSSSVIQADRTVAELLALVPAASAMLLLAFAVTRVDRVWVWFAAGVAASCALLVKQSFVDAAFAGCVCIVAMLLTARHWHERRRVLGRACAYAVGGLVPAAIALAWAATTAVGVSGFVYAIAGFRVDTLEALRLASIPMSERLSQLVAPALTSGMAVLLPLAVAGIWQLRHHGALSALLWAWLAGGMVGMLGGGYYWSHYYIQLIPVVAVGSGLLLARRPRLASATLLAMVVIGLADSHHRHDTLRDRRPHDDARAVGSFVAANGERGDRVLALYARANLVYYSGFDAPVPWLWSSMYRALPEAEPQLRSLLASPQRPTWIVPWQRPSSFGLDGDGRTHRLLEQYYRNVATVCSRTVLLRRDHVPRRLVPATRSCPVPGTTAYRLPLVELSR